METLKVEQCDRDAAWLRDQDGFGEWQDAADALENESPSARITGDKGRENPAEGAPYGEGLIGRIDALSSDCQRLRTALQYIADLAYVDHESGNQNFEHLQAIARDAIRAASDD